MARSWGIICLVMCLFVVGCGEKKSASISGGESREETLHPAENEAVNTNANSRFAGISVSTDFVLPSIAGLEEAQVLLMRGTAPEDGSLYLAKFDGNLPELLATQVHPASITVAPDGSTVAYRGFDGRRHNFHLLDIATREITPLFRASGQFAFIEGWSPDRQWILARDNGENIVFSRDAQTVHHFPNAFSFWLTDNRLLIIETPNFFGANEDTRPLDALYIFNPANGIRTDLDLGFTEFTLDTFPGAAIRSALQAQNTDLVSNLSGAEGALFFPVPLTPDALFLQGAVTNDPCTERTITALEFASNTLRLVASLPETITLSDLAVLPDGTMIVHRWFSDGCNLNPEELQAELLQISPDETSIVLLDNLYPSFVSGFVRIEVGRHYAFSPDGQYILWISGSQKSLETTLHIREMATGDTTDLMTWQSATATDFFTHEAYTGVYWLQ